jgi:hypothetical protein
MYIYIHKHTHIHTHVHIHTYIHISEEYGDVEQDLEESVLTEENSIPESHLHVAVREGHGNSVR